MTLEAPESRFVSRRRKLVRTWPWAGGFMLALLGALTGWLWTSVPSLVNPWVVISRIESGELPESTAHLMAVLLPIVMLVLLTFVAAAILLAFAAFRNERRHIRIIDRLVATAEGQTWSER
jgi:uncharacterized BrkB/YihY/UPF0761 family membrane protein